MKFGVIIRSIGERTEDLCFQSANLWIKKEEISIIKDVSPSYLAYKKMFEIAQERKYDWFLGLDADVILSPNWFDLFKTELLKINPENVFKITFSVVDRITEQNLFRGVHFYNGKYINECIEYLKITTFATNHSSLYKFLGKKSYYLKPESSLSEIALKRKNLNTLTVNNVIGLHGFDQYYSEIFRQYYVRHNRSPNFINEYPNIFNLDKDDKILTLERRAAKFGWEYAKWNKVKQIDTLSENLFRSILSKEKIEEKKPLNEEYYPYYEKNYEEFFSKTAKKILNIDNVLDLTGPGDVVIDLGANIGQESIPFAKRGAKVIAYEPDPFALKELRSLVKESGLSNIDIVPAAVSDKNSKMKLYHHVNREQDKVIWSQSSSLLEDKNNVDKKNYTEVEVKDIYDVLRNAGKKIKILKMDVEGAEYDILDRIIDNDMYKDIGYIFVEVHYNKIPSLVNRHRELISRMRDKNIQNIYLTWV